MVDIEQKNTKKYSVFNENRLHNFFLQKKQAIKWTLTIVNSIEINKY
jgi:hypothetical protein